MITSINAADTGVKILMIVQKPALTGGINSTTRIQTTTINRVVTEDPVHLNVKNDRQLVP